jgi:prevent-host-death family protein
MIISSSDVKNNFGHYLKQVTEENAEVVITKNNVRIARLVPYVTEMDQYYTIKDASPEYDTKRSPISFDEFMEIYEKSTQRMEFIDGEIRMMGSPSWEHQEILGILHIIFSTYFKGKKCRTFLSPFDVIFRKQKVKDPDLLQPDLLVICDTENRNEKGRYQGVPSLTLEIISPSSRSYDMLYKLNSYMISGVSEYWAVDPEQKCIFVYKFSNYDIEKMMCYKNREIVNSYVFEGLIADLEEVFAEA